MFLWAINAGFSLSQIACARITSWKTLIVPAVGIEVVVQRIDTVSKSGNFFVHETVDTFDTVICTDCFNIVNFRLSR